MYSSGYSQVSKHGPGGLKRTQYRSKGKSCGYYMRIVFFFSSLIQSLIIVSLVLFLVYGKTQDSASTERIHDLEESFSRLSIENVALRQQRKNLTNLLNTTLTLKARNDWDLVRFRHYTNISTFVIQDYERKLQQCKQELFMCSASPRFACDCSARSPDNCNCGSLVERLKARLELVESNFTQTIQRMRTEVEQTATERDYINLEAIRLRREKSIQEKELQFNKEKCKDDFFQSLSGVSNVSKAFLKKIESLFPTHLAFQLTCSKQREYLEQIQTNCTSLSREVEDKFQRYLNSVGDQVSDIHAESSRLKAENWRLNSDYRVCTKNRSGLIEEHKEKLDRLQQKNDQEKERLLMDKMRLNGEIEVLVNNVKFKIKEVDHLTQQIRHLNMSCTSKPGFAAGSNSRPGTSNQPAWGGGYGGGGSSSAGGAQLSRTGSGGLGSSLGSSGSLFNKQGSTGTGSSSSSFLSPGSSSSSSGSLFNKQGSTGTGSSSSSFLSPGSSSSLGSSGSLFNKQGSTGTGSSSSSFLSPGSSSSLGSSGSIFNKPGSTGTGSSSSSGSSSSLGSTGSGLSRFGSAGKSSSSSSHSSSGSSSSLGSSGSLFNKPGSTGTGSSSSSHSSSGSSSSLGSSGSLFNKPGSTGTGSSSSSHSSFGSSSSLGSTGSGLNKPASAAGASSNYGSAGSSSSLSLSGIGSNKQTSSVRSSSGLGSSSGSTGSSSSLGSSGIGSNKPTSSVKSSSGVGSSSGSTGLTSKTAPNAFSWFGFGNNNGGQSKTGSETGKGPTSGNTNGGTGSALGAGRSSGLGGGSVNVAQHLQDLQRLINPSGQEEKQDLSRMLG